ncbi:MAG TPA: hypothetical protein VN641_04715 [Urbifossiella sp.]|nr:hypothetical protein [Urbifossiella sp.]
MTNYAVRWHDPASTALLAQLVRAADKQHILRAAREIERRLALNPAEEGESRGASHRLLFVRPLSVLYRIDESATTVYIDDLKWVGK